MKKQLLMSMMLTTALAVSAQDYSGTTFNDRIGHGKDSMEVINNFSL